MSKAFNIDRPNVMIRHMDQCQIDGIREVIARNPENGSLIPSLNSTAEFPGLGCDFRSKSGTIVSVDFRLVTQYGVARLEMYARTHCDSYYRIDILDDLVGDHVFDFRGEELTVRVLGPAEDEPLEIVERSSGYWVVDDCGPVAGPFVELDEAETFVELYSPEE